MPDQPTVQLSGTNTEVGRYANSLLANFVSENSSTSWWSRFSTAGLPKAIDFLMSSVDKMVRFVEQFDAPGADKKMVVLDVLNQMFAVVVAAALPVWLAPFSNSIRYLLVQVVCGMLIDLFVAKYKSGAWNTQGGADVKQEPNAVQPAAV